MIGRSFGVIIYLIGIRKKVARINLQIAYQNKSKFELEKILINTYRHFGMVFMDFLIQPSINMENISDYINLNKKNKNLLINSNGGIIMTAHFGNWEILLPTFGINNLEMSAVIKEQSNSKINSFYINKRTFKNIDLILKNQPVEKLYSSIKKNKFIGLASDQNAKSKGVIKKFFSQNASFPKGSGIFKSRTNCNLFVVFCILGSNYKYHIFIKPIKTNGKDEENIIDDITSQYVSILEKKILQNPCQYFWFHKKWNKKIYK